MREFSVSVVVPFFNRSDCFDRLADSIYKQSLLPKNVYIIDNGSKISEFNKIYELSEKYKDKIFFIFVSTIKKGNANYARNLGLLLSEDDYVAFLDSDDWWEKDHLFESVKILSESNKIGSYCGCVSWSANGSKLLKSFDVNNFDNPMNFFYGNKKGVAQTSSYVIKNKKNALPLWDENLKRHQDYDYFCSIFYSGGWMYCPTIGVNFDRSDAVIGRDFNFKSMIRFCNKWKDILNGDAHKKYLLSQIEICYLVKARARYKNYYKLKYIKIYGSTIIFTLTSSDFFFRTKNLLRKYLPV